MRCRALGMERAGVWVNYATLVLKAPAKPGRLLQQVSLHYPIPKQLVASILQCSTEYMLHHFDEGMKHPMSNQEHSVALPQTLLLSYLRDPKSSTH